MSQSRLKTAANTAAKGVPPGVLKWLTTDDFDEVMDVVLCREFGWSLDYVRSLGVADRAKVEAILNGLNEAENERTKRGHTN